MPSWSLHAGVIRERAMAGTCTVDAGLFDDVKEAIDFVAERGGGVVHTELAGTMFAKSLKLPPDVELKPQTARDQDEQVPAPTPQAA
jgi:hypothetical protein